MKRPLVLAVLTCVTALVLTATPASAHTSLVGSSPAAGSTIHALPESVELTFGDPLMTEGGQDVDRVTVVDPMNVTISAAHADVEGAVASTVLSPSMIMDGDYKVTFRVGSGDGHVVEGAFTFTVDARAPETATASSDAVPTTGTATLTVNATGAGIPGGEGATAGRAAGTFDIDLATSSICYSIVTQGIPDVTAVHVHAANTAAMTVSDEIYVPIDLRAVDKGSPVCTSLKRKDLAALAAGPGRFVMMVHSRAYPEGAVAGPFVDEATVDVQLAAHLEPTGSVPLVLRIAIALLVVVAVGAAVVGFRRRSDGTPHDDTYPGGAS